MAEPLTYMRLVEPRDRDRLIEMRLRLQAHVEASNPRIWKYTEQGKQRLLGDVDTMLDDPEAITLVAETNGEAIGFITGRVSTRKHMTPTTIGFIGLAYVEPEHRRKGVGTRLVRSLCGRFKAAGVDEANLGYIYGNREATEFWRDLDFEPVRVTVNTPLRSLIRRLEEKSI
jgi:GNAT superfamily N-acetyltransferase